MPVFPVAVPRAVVSPGASNCNFANRPGLTVIDELVLGVLLPSEMSVAVVVALPAVLRVTLKVWTPPRMAALPGGSALELAFEDFAH